METVKVTMKKKGAVMVEYLVVLPAFVLLLWVITQVMLYTLASSTQHEAAMEGARLITMETRGYDGLITDMDNQDSVMDKFHEKLQTVLHFNNFVMLYKSELGIDLPIVNVTDASAECTDTLCVSIEDAVTCNALINSIDKKRVICVLTTENRVGENRNHQQVVVKIKSNFRVVGNFIPGIKDTTIVHASGISTKELAGRFQPYHNNGGGS